MKNLIYLLGVSILVYAGYELLVKNNLDSTEDIVQNPIINPGLQTQPEQMFPLQAIETPRVDNADQPWYSGTREFFGSPNSDDMQDLTGNTKDVMVYNTNAFWTSLESKYMH